MQSHGKNQKIDENRRSVVGCTIFHNRELELSFRDMAYDFHLVAGEDWLTGVVIVEQSVRRYERQKQIANKSWNTRRMQNSVKTNPWSPDPEPDDFPKFNGYFFCPKINLW